MIYKHPTGYLLLQQDSESLPHKLDLLNLIPYELDITSTPFCDATILVYDIELPPYGNQISLNLMGDYYFTNPDILDTIRNSPDGYQLMTQAKKNMLRISINGEYPITS